MKVEIKAIAAVLGAVASYLFGGWTMALQTLLVFIVIDYLTGVIASGKSGELSSKIGMVGIGKKVMIFVFVTMGHMADLHTSDGQLHLFRDGVITFFIANEALSILENAGRMGVPVPDVVRKAVEALRRKDDK
jgi:toxin secretion/phage lysis holin